MVNDYKSLLKWLDGHFDTGLDLIRMYLGIGLFVRGVLFISDMERVMGWVYQAGEMSFLGTFLAHYIAVSHLAGGLMLAAGVLTRLAAAAQVPVLFGAVFFVHLPNGLLNPDQSLEFAALVLCILVVLMVFGSGRWSVDAMVFGSGAGGQNQ